MGKLHLRCLGV